MNFTVFVFSVTLLILITFLAGLYPAIALSRFKPVNALKNIVLQSSPSSRISSNVLIVFQNSIAQLLIAATIIISSQVNFLKRANLGFNKNSIIIIPVPTNATVKLPFLRDQLMAQPNVKDVSFCYRPPSSTTDKGGLVQFDNKPLEKFAVRSVIGDENYLKTFKLQLIAGRALTTADTNAHSYLINQQLMFKLGFKSPDQVLGHQLLDGDFGPKNGIIVGIIKDFHSSSLYKDIEPVAIASNSSLYE